MRAGWAVVPLLHDERTTLIVHAVSESRAGSRLKDFEGGDGRGRGAVTNAARTSQRARAKLGGAVKKRSLLAEWLDARGVMFPSLPLGIARGGEARSKTSVLCLFSRRGAERAEIRDSFVTAASLRALRGSARGPSEFAARRGEDEMRPGAHVPLTAGLSRC